MLPIKIFILLSAAALISFSLGQSTTVPLLWKSIGLLVLTIAVAQLLSRIIIKPLQDLTECAKDLSDYDVAQPLSLEKSKTLDALNQQHQDEIGEIAHTLQHLKAEIERYHNVLKQTDLVKQRLEHELEIGRNIQMNMLTLTFPAFPKRKDLELYATLKPAYELGGDFYDFYFFRENTSYLFEENRFCFCIGDVSGKGVPAALFMAVIKILMKSQANIDFSPAKILTHVNQIISLDNPSCMFATLFFGIINLSNGELIYTNAGHNPPYIRRCEGTLEPVAQRHGPPLGVIENLTYKESKTRLKTGDLLIAYTDGVTEAVNSENKFFSQERLSNLLASGEYVNPEDVINLMTEAVLTFQGNAKQADDITLLSLQFLGHPAAKGELLELSIKNDVLLSLKEQWE